MVGEETKNKDRTKQRYSRLKTTSRTAKIDTTGTNMTETATGNFLT